jgi:hypothetical protein
MRGSPNSDASLGAAAPTFDAREFLEVVSKSAGAVVSNGRREGRRMPPTSEAIDLTELAELLEDEDPEAD